MSLIVNYWPVWFRALYGGEFPRSYCCIDVETTGYSFDRDVITEWGHCLVQDGKVVDRLALVLNWANHDVVPDHWLRNRLDYVRKGMELSGKVCSVTYDRMKAEGMEPARALAFVRDFTGTLLKKGTVFVAHNGVFDENMISANLAGFKVAPGFSFGDNGMLDTEGIEKASQLVDNERMHPRKGDTLRTYFHRVKYTRAQGLKSNLDDHCYLKYLAKLGIDRAKLHGAGEDSYCVHLLMEEYRKLLTAPQTPPAFPPADHRAARKGQVIAARLPQPGPSTRVRGQRRS